jgi:hypothetical protein
MVTDSPEVSLLVLDIWFDVLRPDVSCLAVNPS